MNLFDDDDDDDDDDAFDDIDDWCKNYKICLFIFKQQNSFNYYNIYNGLICSKALINIRSTN